MKRIAHAISAFACLMPVTAIGADAPGGPSPEAAFVSHQAAYKAKDYKAAFAQMTPGMQDESLDGLAHVLHEPDVDETKRADAAKILENHALPVVPIDPRQDRRAILKRAFANVKDKAACFDDMVRWMGRNSTARGPKIQEISEATLSDVTIDGDAAVGRIKVNYSGQEVNAPMKFKKIDNRWFIDGAK
jgi:hypothetical protein